MIKKVLFERKYKAGYTYRRELHDGSEYGGKDFEMKMCYTPSGDWIGTPREARLLYVKRGLTRIQKSHPSHCVCSIGFDARRKKWFGWSHRAVCGFGVGDKLFTQRCKGATDKTPFVKHGRTTIVNLGQAKIAAKRFAEYVS